MAQSKGYAAALALVDRNKRYGVDDAFKTLTATYQKRQEFQAKRRDKRKGFDETVEVHRRPEPTSSGPKTWRRRSRAASWTSTPAFPPRT